MTQAMASQPAYVVAFYPFTTSAGWDVTPRVAYRGSRAECERICQRLRKQAREYGKDALYFVRDGSEPLV